MQIRINYPQHGILTSNNPVIQTRTNVVIPLPAGDGKLKDANEVISEQGQINNEALCYQNLPTIRLEAVIHKNMWNS